MNAKRRLALRLLIWVCLLTLVSACTPGRQDSVEGAHLLLAEVYPGGRVSDGVDQYIRLHNPTGQPVELAGWSIGDTKVRAVFGPGVRIGARQSLYVARDAAGFQATLGAPPEYVWGAGTGGAQPLSGGVNLLLSAASGAVLLRDATSQVVDALVYGAPPGQAVTGWRGPALQAPLVGEVMDRARSETSWTDRAPGDYTADTDTAADWKQGRMWLDGRTLRPGQTWFGYPTYSVGSVTTYATPDTTFRILSDALDRARTSIDVNVYDFSVVTLADKLAAAARRGVKVRLLMEAGSVSALNDQERYMGKLVAEAGGQVRWVLNSPNQGYMGRYVYNHAKYAVVDGRVSLVQSENFVRHGTAPDPSFGNRGWGVMIDDTPLAAYLTRVFEADWNPAYGDVVQYQPGTPFGPPAPGFVPETGAYTGEYPHPFPTLTIASGVKVTPVLAPDHTLLETKGIIGLLRSARESISIQQQYVQVYCVRYPKPNSAIGRLFCCRNEAYRVVLPTGVKGGGAASENLSEKSKQRGAGGGPQTKGVHSERDAQLCPRPGGG